MQTNSIYSCQLLRSIVQIKSLQFANQLLQNNKVVRWNILFCILEKLSELRKLVSLHSKKQEWKVFQSKRLRKLFLVK